MGKMAVRNRGADVVIWVSCGCLKPLMGLQEAVRVGWVGGNVSGTDGEASCCFYVVHLIGAQGS